MSDPKPTTDQKPNVVQPKPTEVDNSKKNTIEEEANDLQDAVSRKVEKFLLSNKDTVDAVSEKLQSKLLPVAQEFVKNNPEKIEEYESDPDALIRDIKASDVFKYLDWLMVAIEGAFFASSIFSLVATVMSGGTAAAATIPAEAVKWSMRTAIKSYIKKYGERLIVKILHKQIIKILKSSSASVLGNIAKHFIKSAAIHATLTVVLNLILTMLEDVGLTAVKNILADKGVSDFNLPRDLVEDLLKAKEPSAFKRITKNFLGKTESDLTKLFTTQAGFKKIAFGSALSKLWELRAMKGPKQKLENIKGKLKEAANDPKYKKNLSREEQEKIKKQQSSMSKEELLKKISNSSIPVALIPHYVNTIQELLRNKNKLEAGKIVENKIIAAETLAKEIRDELREVEVLNFIKDNQKQLPLDQVNKLMADVTETQLANVKSLMSEAEVDNLDQLIATMKRNKLIGVDQQINTLALSSRDPKLKQKIVRDLAQTNEVAEYKEKLKQKMEPFMKRPNLKAPQIVSPPPMKSLKTPSPSHSTANYTQRLRAFAERLMK